jgi:hypothetical protein
MGHWMAGAPASTLPLVKEVPDQNRAWLPFVASALPLRVYSFMVSVALAHHPWGLVHGGLWHGR